MTIAERAPGAWRRRAVTIPVWVLCFGVTLALLPVLLGAALAIDVARDRRLPTTRLVLFAVLYFGCETAGLAAAAVLAVASRWSNPERTRARYHALQGWWAGTLLAGMRRLFAVRIETEGDDAVGRGPVLVFVRHASLADTLLPAVLVGRRHGLRLRWVLKRELLQDPCLDVVGHRLPNVFVRRGSGDSAREIAAIRDLAVGLGPRDGVLIYPEGTRATPAKRARARAVLVEADPARAARLAPLDHLLPPRSGGPLALLDAAPHADVVFMAHAGLDGVATLADAWRGALIGRSVQVAFRRVAAAAVPSEPAARLAWLDGEWLRMDAWVASRAPARSAPPSPRRRRRCRRSRR